LAKGNPQATTYTSITAVCKYVSSRLLSLFSLSHSSLSISPALVLFLAPFSFSLRLLSLFLSVFPTYVTTDNFDWVSSYDYNDNDDDNDADDDNVVVVVLDIVDDDDDDDDCDDYLS
jgi:hypothetical protein